MKKAMIIILFVLSFSIFNSCATTAKYEAILNSWMGSDINSLISSWGPPGDVFVMPNDNKMYTWLYDGGTSVVSNYNYYLRMTTTNAISHWCKTTFTVDTSGKIISWRYDGNSCRSK